MLRYVIKLLSNTPQDPRKIHALSTLFARSLLALIDGVGCYPRNIVLAQHLEVKSITIVNVSLFVFKVYFVNVFFFFFFFFILQLLCCYITLLLHVLNLNDWPDF